MVRVGTETLLFERIARLAFTERVSLSSTGCYATPKVTWDRDAASGRPFLYFACGAACSKVTVDTETGEMRVDSALDGVGIERDTTQCARVRLSSG